MSHIDHWPANKRINLTVHASRPLLSRLRPTSPRKSTSNGRATCPAGYAQRWTDCEAHLRTLILLVATLSLWGLVPAARASTDPAIASSLGFPTSATGTDVRIWLEGTLVPQTVYR